MKLKENAGPSGGCWRSWCWVWLSGDGGSSTRRLLPDTGGAQRRPQQSVLATGKLDALRKVDVGAQVSGQLKTLHVNIGDKVKRTDQLLGVIDPERAQNQIKEVEATLMELRAQLNQARAESKLAQVTLARQQQLAQRQLVSRQDLDTAATDLAVKQAQIGTIEAQIKRNQATLDTAKTNLDYTRILAPMAGEVTQITALQGQTVIAAQQALADILTLADLSTMLVKAQVSEADVIHLRPGQKAWFTVLGDPLTRYEGKLKDILPTPEKSQRRHLLLCPLRGPEPAGDPAPRHDRAGAGGKERDHHPAERPGRCGR